MTWIRKRGNIIFCLRAETAVTAIENDKVKGIFPLTRSITTVQVSQKSTVPLPDTGKRGANPKHQRTIQLSTAKSILSREIANDRIIHPDADR